MPPKIRYRPKPPTAANAADPIKPATGSATDLTADAEPTYVVGKNRPPQHTRFGQPSGNRPGRKPRPRGFDQFLKRELEANVVLYIDGREVRLSKEQLIAQTWVNGAVKGDRFKIDSLIRHKALVPVKAAEAAAVDDSPFDLEDDGVAALQALADLVGLAQPVSVDDEEADS